MNKNFLDLVSSIRYQIKCFFKRYTTVKSRHLPNTWVDKVDILTFTMFEILEKFVEEECSPEYVEWYGDGAHKINVNGVTKFVRDEIDDLLKWWNEVYLPYYNGDTDPTKNVDPPKMVFGESTGNIAPLEFEYKDSEHEKQWADACKESRELEVEMYDQLTDHMERLCRIRGSLWT